MTQEKQTRIKKNGQAAAAMIAAMIALLSLGISNLASSLSNDFKQIVHEFGKAWIPGAEAIGPYSGKETIMLFGWGISWLILYFMLRNRQVHLSKFTIIFIIGTALATLFVWSPFVHLFK